MYLRPMIFVLCNLSNFNIKYEKHPFSCARQRFRFGFFIGTETKLVVGETELLNNSRGYSGIEKFQYFQF